MEDDSTVSFTVIGPDTGVARLVADLELAGADDVTAEPDPDAAEHLMLRSYFGTLRSMTPEQVSQVAAAYLATTTGQRMWVDGTEVAPGP
jgi:hypothetical protein